jgi:hypothetical protein
MSSSSSMAATARIGALAGVERVPVRNANS